MKTTAPSKHQHQQPQHFWSRVFKRRWLHLGNKVSDYSADTDDDDDDVSDFDSNNGEFCEFPRGSMLTDIKEEEPHDDPKDGLPRLQRRNSETFRAQYINTKEIKICVGTWNVGGKLPPDELDIESWLEIDEPADVYVIGFQEIIPLNAGNIFGSEDSRSVSIWENVIRENLNKIQTAKTNFKCYSDPSSPSRFKLSDDAPDIEDEVVLESDSDGGEEIYPINDECNGLVEESEGPFSSENLFMYNEASVSKDDTNVGRSSGQSLKRQVSSPKRLDRMNCFRTDDSEENSEPSVCQNNRMLTKTLSGVEKIGLSWPELPLDLLAQHVLDRPKSFTSDKSFRASKSFGRYSSFKSSTNESNRRQSDAALFVELNLESLLYRKRRPSYVRILSKQLVGIFLTIWVRRTLRKHIQYVNVSSVGVGVMGFIGNKGSISVSMSIYQTFFCFVCTHLTAGEKDADAVKRNADVSEIHRRTHFNSHSSIGLPKTIHDHERIIWLGDLNYRINLSYTKTQELISKKEWSKLLENDQLTREIRKGRAFDGWSEGTLNFPPTYKYEINSENYYGEDPKTGRRTPAWCDRILSFGKGIKLLNYRRSELRLSDHRPVTTTYMTEVEVFSPRKLQRALTFTDAEIEDDKVVTDMGIEGRINSLILGEGKCDWEH